MSQLGMMSGGYNTGSYNPYVPTDASADDYIDSSISGDMNIGTPSSFDPSSDSSSSDSGSFYNPDFGSDFGSALSGNQDLGSMGYFQKTPGLFDFGDRKLFNDGKGLQTPSWIGEALKAAGLSGYDTTGIRQGLSLANLTPNSAFDIAASYTGNPYLGMLNDDFSQRGLVNKGLNFAGVPYSGSIMGAIDYSQGKNNWGALGQTVGAIAGATPVGMLGSYLLGNYLGDEYGSKWNENLTGPARDFADTHGLEPGTDDFDQAIDLFVHTMNDPKATQEQKDLVNFYMEDYKNQKFDPEWFGDKVMPSNWQEGEYVDEEWSPERSIEIDKKIRLARESGKSVSSDDVSDEELHNYNQDRMDRMDNPGNSGPVGRTGGTDFSPNRWDSYKPTAPTTPTPVQAPAPDTSGSDDSGSEAAALAEEAEMEAMMAKAEAEQAAMEAQAEAEAATKAQAIAEEQALAAADAKAKAAAEAKAEAAAQAKAQAEAKAAQAAKAQAEAEAKAAQAAQDKADAEAAQQAIDDSYGDTDISEGTEAGDYAEAGFTQEEADFAQSFDDDSGSEDAAEDAADDGGWGDWGGGDNFGFE
jgi:hypothetical protein